MSAPETINFTRGVPAVESYPTQELADAAAAALPQHAEAMLMYTPSSGLALLRNWIAAWQQVKPDEVMVGNGSLELLEFLTLSLLKPTAR
jgi:DNA-binding transcriptional MocR family regulator